MDGTAGLGELSTQSGKAGVQGRGNSLKPTPKAQGFWGYRPQAVVWLGGRQPVVIGSLVC